MRPPSFASPSSPPPLPSAPALPPPLPPAPSPAHAPRVSASANPDATTANLRVIILLLLESSSWEPVPTPGLYRRCPVLRRSCLGADLTHIEARLSDRKSTRLNSSHVA